MLATCWGGGDERGRGPSEAEARRKQSSKAGRHRSQRNEDDRTPACRVGFHPSVGREKLENAACYWEYERGRGEEQHTTKKNHAVPPFSRRVFVSQACS